MAFQWQIQRAAYDALAADIPLTELVEGVFDFVPGNQKFPYISLGSTTDAPDDTLDKIGTETTLQVDCWSRFQGANLYQGKGQLKQIMDRVDAILHRGTLVLTDSPPTGQFVDCIRELSLVNDDSDGLTKHGIMRFRVRVYSA